MTQFYIMGSLYALYRQIYVTILNLAKLTSGDRAQRSTLIPTEVLFSCVHLLSRKQGMSAYVSMYGICLSDHCVYNA